MTAEGGRLRQTTDVNAWELLAGSRFANTVVLSGDDSSQRFRTSVAQALGATAAYDSADWLLYWQGTDTRQDAYEERRAVPPRAPPVQLDRRFRFRNGCLARASPPSRASNAAALRTMSYMAWSSRAPGSRR